MESKVRIAQIVSDIVRRRASAFQIIKPELVRGAGQRKIEGRTGRLRRPRHAGHPEHPDR